MQQPGGGCQNLGSSLSSQHTRLKLLTDSGSVKSCWRPGRCVDPGGFPGAICGLNMAFPKLQNWMRCITRAASLIENCKTYHKTRNCDQPKGPLLVCGAIWCFSASLQMNLGRSSDSSSGYKLGESAPFRRLASILGAIPCTIDSDRVDIVSAARKIAPNVQPG